jgi:hypothetical protein
MVGAEGAGMIAGAMVGWRNPARYIAPLALAAAVAATYLVVHHALLHKHSSTSTTTTQTTSTVVHHHGKGPSASSKAKFYVVGLAFRDRGEDRRFDHDDRGPEPAPQPERSPAVAAHPAAAVRRP